MRNSPLHKNARSSGSAKKNATSFASACVQDTQDASALQAQSMEANPFLVLQEMDEYESEQSTLKNLGSNILNGLNQLRWNLLNNELDIDNVSKLKKILESNQYQFKFPELQQVIDDLLLRCEVEIAKFTGK